MIIFKTIQHLHQHLDSLTTTSIGFVPTMGALHNGHISLINQAKQNNACVICSIFVNPTQFNNPTDFIKYPITIEQDIYALEKAGCTILFLPTVQEMYPEGLENGEVYTLGFIETILEGAYRPGHFNGVCRIVNKLLQAVQPTDLFLGQKDYQQCMVINKLLQLKNYAITLHVCATQREIGGLAMSSRNSRLTAEEKIKAQFIFKTLTYIQQHIQAGNIEPLLTTATQNLLNAGFTVDYIAVADANTLQLITVWNGTQKLVALAAVFVGEVRLIDNLIL